MIAIALLVVVVLVVLGAMGIGPLVLGDPDRRRDRLGVSLTPLVVVGLGVAVLLFLVSPLVLFGMRDSSDHESLEPPPGAVPASTTTTTTSTPTPTTTVVRGAEPERASSVLGPEVRIDTGARAVGDLRPDTVLQVHVTGMDPFTAAHAKQCAGGRCGNVIDVQLGENGAASFQYLVVDDFVPAARAGRCRLDAAPCSIVVEHDRGDVRVELATVFHDPLPPPGVLQVEPRSGLLEGDELEVVVDGLPPGAAIEVVLCALPASPERCGEPGPVVPVTIGDDGSATASLTVGRTDVGSARAACGGGSGCGVGVQSDAAFVRVEPVRLTFSAPPGADYDGGRLAIGLGLGAALLLLALLLIRRTDWSPVGEERAPEIDDAEYADLDAIIALLPPEEDDESVLAQEATG